MITQNDVRIWLLKAIKILVDRNQGRTNVTFPSTYIFHISLAGYSDRFWGLPDLSDILLRNEHVPVVADIAVAGIWEDKTIIEVFPSGHDWVKESTETWGGTETGPFKAMNWYLQFLQPMFKGGMSVPGLAEFVLNARSMVQRYGEFQNPPS